MRKGVLMAVLVGSLVWLPSLVFALDVTLIGYYIPTTYSDKVAKPTDTTVMGMYGYFGLGEHALELGVDQIVDSTTRASVQQNFAGIYTYSFPEFQVRVGGVDVMPADGTGQGLVGLAGGSYDHYVTEEIKDWTLGMDGFYSQYSGGPKVVQVTPYGKAYFAVPWQVGWAEAGVKANWIKLSSGSLMSESVSGRYHWGAFSVGAEYFLGDSEYAVYNGGFVVMNTADVLHSGYTLTGTWSFLPKWELDLNYQTQTLTPNGADVDSMFTKTSMMVVYSF